MLSWALFLIAINSIWSMPPLSYTHRVSNFRFIFFRQIYINNLKHQRSAMLGSHCVMTQLMTLLHEF